MNKIIDIQQPSVTYNSYNEPIETWKDVAGLTGLFASIITSGSIELTKSRELYSAQKLYSEVTVVFKLRYIDGITNLMRIKYNDRFFNIISVNNVNQNDEFLLIYGKEVV